MYPVLDGKFLAKEQLKDGEITVTEIAYDAGFNDLKHFRNCLAKQFGTTPSFFRKINHEQGTNHNKTPDEYQNIVSYRL